MVATSTVGSRRLRRLHTSRKYAYRDLHLTDTAITINTKGSNLYRGQQKVEEIPQLQQLVLHCDL